MARTRLAILITLLAAGTTAARIISVSNRRSAPADFDNIQAAIDDSNDGDTVLVADGTYTEDGNRDIDFKGKAITVRSENGPESCIIDCSQPELPYDDCRGFHFHSGEDSNSVLSGFTITNGVVSSCPMVPGGGAILCSLSSPTIKDCAIVNNLAFGWCAILGSAGGGIFLDQSNATIANCLIVGNTSYEGGDGAGIYCLQSSPIVTNCTISDNAGNGIMSCELSNPVIVNCTFWGNSTEQIIVESDGYYEGPSSAVVAFSNVQNGWPGLGNIDQDPCFVSPGYFDPNDNLYDTFDDFWVDGDYHLRSEGWRWDTQRRVWTWDDVTSRCIDAGSPASPLGDEPLSIPADPNNDWGQNLRINMGAYGGTSQASMAPHAWSVSKDYNNDGIVNFTDLACWLVYRAYSLGQGPGDSNGSPAFNTPDLALLADAWLDQATWFTTPSSEPNLPPAAASNPNPPDGSHEVSTSTVLSWQGHFDAISHDIYFGTTNPPPFQTNQPGTIFEPGSLSLETTYYWRIDEVKPYGTTAGPLWNFTTTAKLRMCFSADTLVWADGKLVSIINVVPGQKVGMADSPAEVEWIQEHGVGAYDCYDVVFESGNSLVAVHSHNFLTVSGEWAPVENLAGGSKLQGLNGQVGITSVTKRAMPFVGNAYNLKIKGANLFYVGKDAVAAVDCSKLPK